tara:strand:+ start:506 stop:997 length:492 start_codon:yes stop_codon:yes gene_type:complete
MSSKTFTKNNLVFNIPDGIDLNDRHAVKDYFVQRDRLFIENADGSVICLKPADASEKLKKQVQKGKAKARKAVEDAKAICPPAVEQLCVACGGELGCMEYTTTDNHGNTKKEVACRSCAEEHALGTEEQQKKRSRDWLRSDLRERMGCELSDEDFEKVCKKLL